jgi:hypothetical protein
MARAAAESLTDLADLSESALLEEFEVLHAAQREAEARVLVAAVQWALVNNAETVDPDLAKLPGRQRAIRVGGDGTPRVAEFAASFMAARLELSARAGQRLLADALDLRFRLPRLWGRVQALEVRAGHARFVAQQTRDLTLEQAAYVDDRVAEVADGRLPWNRFVALVEAAVTAADEEAARRREAEAAERQFAKPTRSDEHGIRGFYVRADFATIARLDATIAYLAEALQALGDPGTVDERRVRAVLFLANPVAAVQLLRAYAAWRTNPDRDQSAPEPERFDPNKTKASTPAVPDDTDLLPMIQLIVHVLAGKGRRGSDEPSIGPVARVEGRGPITARWVGEHLGPRCRFRILPVLDPLGQVPVDAYEIPVRHREAVRVLSPADCFPFAAHTGSMTGGSMQIDHTEEYVPGRPGQSRIGNYGPMVAFHHRLKTHGSWHVKQPFPGLYLWRDGHGATYLVDHTGTRRINPAA